MRRLMIVVGAATLMAAGAAQASVTVIGGGQAEACSKAALASEGLDDEKSAYFDYQKAVELSPDWDAPKAELLRFHVSSKP